MSLLNNFLGFKNIGMNKSNQMTHFETPMPSANQTTGDIYVSPSMADMGIFKAYMPKYLYRPPFGYPRMDNVYLERQLAKNPWIYSIIKTIMDEVALAEWDIKYKETSEKQGQLDDLQKEIKKFIDNPNRNEESWSDVRKQVVTDICEVDAGIIVKVFNKGGRMVEMFAKDGGSFLKSPDIYGYMGNKAQYIIPANLDITFGQQAYPEVIKQYAAIYDDAAYYQYATAVSASIPVPFGRREVIYMMQNPRTDSPYGVSPIAILSDIIMSLVFGGNYSLDFYMNSNMPEGIISLIGANQTEIKSFRERMEKEFRVQDPNTGFWRKIGFKVPITQYQSTFTPFMLDPKTMQIIEQQQWFYKLALACFGVPPDEVGMTENSNRAVGASQWRVYLRKAARPIMQLIKYKIDKEIISEWGPDAYENLEYVWDDYDLDEDLKKHELYKKKLEMGITTPEMIAKEEGVDYEEVKTYMEEKKQEALELAQAGQMNINQNFGGGNSPDAGAGQANAPEPDVQTDDLYDKLLEKQGVNDTTMKSISPQNEAEVKILDSMEQKKVLLKGILKNMQFERGRVL